MKWKKSSQNFFRRKVEQEVQLSWKCFRQGSAEVFEWNCSKRPWKSNFLLRNENCRWSRWWKISSRWLKTILWRSTEIKNYQKFPRFWPTKIGIWGKNTRLCHLRVVYYYTSVKSDLDGDIQSCIFWKGCVGFLGYVNTRRAFATCVVSGFRILTRKQFLIFESK